MTKMIACKTCGKEIAKSAKVCPHCGAQLKKPIGTFVLLAFVVVIAGMFGIRHFNMARNEAEHTAKGYGIMTFADGSTVTAREMNEEADKSRVAAEAKYLNKEVTVTVEVTEIDNIFIADFTDLIRFSYSDYSLTTNDYNILTSVQVGDVLKITGQISYIGGGDWYVELQRITSIKKISSG